MRLKNHLRPLPGKVLTWARDHGLPVAAGEHFLAERVQPQLIKSMSRFVIPFVRRTGVRITALDAGRVVCRMPLKGNVNHIGTMYAGALFTLAEFPGGPLMLATFGLRRYVPIVTSLDLEFVKAAKTDISIELRLLPLEAERIEAATLAEGEAAFVLEGELKNTAEEVVARSKARYLMRPRRR